MTTVLAYFPSPPQGVWHLGPLPVRAYALFIIAGIVVALILGDRRWEARGGERGVIYDIALWAVPFGLVGGRLYHLATDWRTYWGPGGAGLGGALRIWDGGLGIWGAVALGGVGAWIACRRRGIPLPAFADAIAPGIVLAQAIGRLGNYFNQELYGRETTLPWGLEIFYRRDPAGYVDPHSLDGVSTGQVALVVQPTFLYELIWNLLVFAALIYLDRRFRLGHGRLFALYVAGYCVGRFAVELLRDDTATHIAGIRINSFTSTFVFIGAVVYFILAPKDREDPESLGGNDGDVEVMPQPEPAATDAVVGEDYEPAGAADAAESADVAEAEVSEPEGPEAPAETEERDAPEPEPEPETETIEPDAEASAVDEPAAEGPVVAAVPQDTEAGSTEPETDETEDTEETEGTEGHEAEEAEPETEDTEEPEAEEAEPEAEEPKAEELKTEDTEDTEDPGDTEDTEEPEAEEAEPEAEEPEAEEPEAEETEGARDTGDTGKTGEPEADEAEPGGEDASEGTKAVPGAVAESDGKEATAGEDGARRRRFTLRRRNRS